MTLPVFASSPTAQLVLGLVQDHQANDVIPKIGPPAVRVRGPECWARKTGPMKRHRHTPEQVVRKLREGERLLNAGKDLSEVLRTLEISEATWNRWRNQYGGMKVEEAKRLKELEIENARLKKIVANQALDIDMLKELSRDCSYRLSRG